MNIKQINLPNGIKLLHVQGTNLPFDLVSVWFRAGSRFDPQGKEGLAHLFEHLFMAKTNAYPDKINRLRELEGHGIYFNAMVNREIAYYYHSQLPTETKFSFEMLLDGASSSLIKKEDLEQEKGVIYDEAARNKENPANYIWDLNFKSLFDNSSLGRDFYGSQSSWQSIQMEDIEDFRNKYYQINNLSFVVISECSTNDLLLSINKYFNDKYLTPIADVKVENFSKLKSVNIVNRDLDNLQVSYNFRVLHPNQQELVILDFISYYLANTWMSRLIVKLRLENNLTYWVEGESFGLQDVAYLSLVFSTTTANINEILAIIKNEVAVLSENVIVDEFLENYKKSYKARFIKKLTDPYELLFYYGYPFALGRDIVILEKYSDSIDQLNAEQIRNIAEKYLILDNISINVIGNIKIEEIKI